MSLTNYDKSLKLIEYTIRWFGIELECRPLSLRDKILNRLRGPAICLIVDLDLGGSFYWFFSGLLAGKTIAQLAYVMPCITVTSMVHFKLYTFYSQKKIVQELVQTLQTIDGNDVEVTRTDEEAEVIKNEIEFLHKSLRVQRLFSCMLTAGFSSMPLIQMLIIYLNSNNLVLLLPLMVTYPFNPFYPIIWPIMYTRQFFSVFFVVFGGVATEGFFYICCTYVRLHFRLLKIDIENLLPSNDHNVISFFFNDYKEKLRNIVLTHEQLINCVILLEKIYAASTLFNFVSSSFAICLTGFNAKNMEDKPLITLFVIFLTTCLLQIFSFCWHSDSLMTSSQEIGDGVYNSAWYLADTKIRMTLLIILARAQRPCKLSALGFADVNLAACSRVLTTAYSYFTLLNAVYAE